MFILQILESSGAQREAVFILLAPPVYSIREREGVICASSLVPSCLISPKHQILSKYFRLIP